MPVALSRDVNLPYSRAGFLLAETCFCQTLVLKRFKPVKTETQFLLRKVIQKLPLFNILCICASLMSV